MTIQALEKEVLELPPRSRVRIAEKIIESVDDFTDPKIEKAWTEEIGRRVKEIESGNARGIPARTAMKKIRHILNEARHLSSSRGK